MTIAPRCATSAASTGASTLSPPLTSWTNAGAGPPGTAPAAGDIVFLIGTVNTNSMTSVTQTGGTGTWSFNTNNDSNGGASAGMSTFMAYRVFDGTETAPTFSWGSSLHNNWSAIALAPDSGAVAVIDTWAAIKKDTSVATTHTANAATAAGTGEISVILAGGICGAAGTTAFTYTAPASWTLAPGSPVSTTASKIQGSAVAYQTGQSGTVTPGAMTIEGGSSGTGTTEANLYHVLVAEVFTPPPLSTQRPFAVTRAAFY